MANAKTYYIDPAVFKTTAIAGAAQHPADRDNTTWTKLLTATNIIQGAGFETLDTTTTTLALDVHETQLSVSGTMAFTLPDGTQAGQRKLVRCIVAASIPLATLTVTTPETLAGFVCPAAWIFDTVGQAVEFYWTGTKWRVLRSWRAGQKTLTVGSTATAGMNLYQLFALSISGTANSTGANALPDGTYPGDQLTVGCNNAASIPSGSIDGHVSLASGVAGSGGTGGLGKLATWSNTTANVGLVWSGTSWQVVASIGGIVAS